MLRHSAAMTGVQPSSPLPQGATWDGRGTSFSLYSEHATGVELCLFDDAHTLRAQIALTARHDGLWHGYVADVGPGQRYAYRVHGPLAPEHGHRFMPQKLLVDPYARALDRETRWHPLLEPDHQDSAPVAAKSVVIDPSFAWGDDAAPRVSWRDTVIYECHVKGFTKLHPEIEPALRGTYLGLATAPAIEHLLSLGVTAVELLPVQQSFSERFLVERGLSNYWGYNTVAFFAPDIRYASSSVLGAQVGEFKSMVKALHSAGLEVILDVVYNHTGEADELGPVVSLRGIDDAVYYRSDPRHAHRYVDTTGCGNSLRVEHPQVLRMVLDSLRYWVTEMHVDGFRFDLAPALARSGSSLDVRSGFFAAVAQDPVLSRVKLIAEPWDCGPNGSNTGGFGHGYAEWNDRYRDGVRRFWRGASHGVNEIVRRMSGSDDLFAKSGRSPLAGVSYVTSHDGFSLLDLVSYAQKHNEANGWSNGDGSDNELSDNWGVEGATDREDINERRARVSRSMLATLACSLGVPMLRQGDELDHSQRGNNNAYAQDNELSWMSWESSPKARAQLSFVRAMMRVRRELHALRSESFFTGAYHDGEQDVRWLREDGAALSDSEWNDGGRRCFGMQVASGLGAWAGTLIVLVNASAAEVRFRLPQHATKLDARVLIDTSRSEQHETTRSEVEHVNVPAHTLMLLQVDQARALPVRHGGSAALRTLASRMGIVDSYFGYDGTQQYTHDDTRISLLHAMGIDASSEQRAVHLLHELDAELAAPGFEPVRVLPLGSDAIPQLLVHTRNSQAARIELHAELETEDGRSHSFDQRITHHGNALCLPWSVLASLPVGYHRIEVSLRGAVDLDASQDLIIAPRSCFGVSDAIGERRAYGINAHLYALRGDHGFGVGDLGDLGRLASFAAAANADFVGHNPLHAVDNFTLPVSPYFPLSRIFGNPIYIDIEAVPELASSDVARALLDREETRVMLTRLRAQARIDYAASWRLKRKVLHALHATFVAAHQDRDTERGRAYAAFLERHGTALHDFALFCAIGDALGGEGPARLDAQHFPSELRDPRSASVARFAEGARPIIAFHMYLQFELDRQLGACQRGARQSGMSIGLYADLAVGNAPGGSDVWSRPELFARGASLGAPPDAYSAEGQGWGLRPLLPHRLRADRYRYFTALCRESMRHAGLLRIDHVMGIMRQFWVPDGKTAKGGAYISLPFEDLAGIVALESVRARTLIVGEDLGVVPSGLRERMAELHMSRSQVLYFEREYHGAFKSPHDYARDALATVNTHDLPPLIGFWSERDLEVRRSAGQLIDDASFANARAERDGTKRALLDILQREGCIELDEAPETSPSDLVVAVHRLLARTRSVLVGAAFDDLCMELDALNIPGLDLVTEPSWSRRATKTIESLHADATAARILAVLSGLRSRKLPRE